MRCDAMRCYDIEDPAPRAATWGAHTTLSSWRASKERARKGRKHDFVQYWPRRVEGGASPALMYVAASEMAAASWAKLAHARAAQAWLA
jgi:hypothetical protein